MIVESVQRVYSLTPLYSEQRVFTTSVDPKTNKEYHEIVTYRVYNSQGQLEESRQSKIDTRV